MSAIFVRSVATGRARLTGPWLRDRPGCAGLVDDRLTHLGGFHASGSSRERQRRPPWHLIKGGTHLEGIGRVAAVVFDKTGTLTFGGPLVTSVVTLNERFGTDDVLSLAASGALHARHPLARAIVTHTEEQHLHVPIHQACEVVLGMGLRAELDGTRLLVGSPALQRRHGIELTEDAQGWTDHLRRSGATVICLAQDEEFIGLLAVSDAVRAAATSSSGSCATRASRGWSSSPATPPRPPRSWPTPSASPKCTPTPCRRPNSS
ncbi:HAD family hydrolase [Streptomyces sp. NPDC006463]|uniref:HAD family hydrolase n=1 Tax=Streptomyces sp. NPDC006463 TaxID=3364746 RepID=UPI0036A8E427